MTASKLRLLALLGTATLLAFAPGPAPAPWTAQDIGGPAVAGSTTFDPATGVWTVIGGGGDIWGTGDQLQLASIPLTGDVTVTARVITQGNTDVWAKAGVMIRETNAAGSTFAMAAITPGNGTIVQWRDTTGAGANWPGAGASGAVPMWERINRTGNVFTGYYSTDGVTWVANGNVTITMAASVLAGLEVTSHNNGAGMSSTVTYDSVSIVNGAGLFYWPLTPPTNLMATNAINAVNLSWTASPNAASYIISRSPTTGGPYTPLPGGTTTGTTFTDNTAVNPNSYFYVVQAVQGAMTSVYSNEATGTPLPPPVSALPNTGLQTNENGAQTQFDIKFNQPAAAGVVVTVSSNDITEGTVSTAFAAGVVTPTATGFTVQVAVGTSPTITVIVTGVDDALVDGNVPYTVSVSATNMGGIPIPDVQLVNNDNDVAGMTFSRTAGLVTSENLTSDSFTVVLNRQPFGNVTMTLASSNMAEGTVSPLTMVFTPGDYNMANQHIVTVTGVDDAVLDFTQPYTIITNPLTFSDPRDAAAFATAGAIDPPNVSCVNIDNEQIPALPHVWGGSGSGGGCGLTGLEVLLFLGAGAAWRRRRRIA